MDASEQKVPADEGRLERRVGRPAPERTCDQGCNGCDECTDYDADDDAREVHEFGCCLPPGECCMPGLHLPSECHTVTDYEREHGVDWCAPPNA